MTSLVQAFTFFASVGVVAMNIVTLFLIFALTISKKRNEKKDILDWISFHALSLSFLIACASILSSLFYSLIAHYTPCEMCWYQRVILIAITVFYGKALVKVVSSEKKAGIVTTNLILSVVAALVGIYQYYGSMFNPALLAACEANGVSCAKNYFVSFGYINIPFMALSTFLLLVVIALVRIRRPVIG